MERWRDSVGSVTLPPVLPCPIPIPFLPLPAASTFSIHPKTLSNFALPKHIFLCFMTDAIALAGFNFLEWTDLVFEGEEERMREGCRYEGRRDRLGASVGEGSLGPGCRPGVSGRGQGRETRPLVPACPPPRPPAIHQRRQPSLLLPRLPSPFSMSSTVSLFFSQPALLQTI